MSDDPIDDGDANDEEDDEDDEIEFGSVFEDGIPAAALARVTAGLFAGAISSALMPLWYSLDECTFKGDRVRGTYRLSNGQGDFAVYVWAPEGLVVTTFDHEENPHYDTPWEERRPLRYLRGLPSALRELADAAIEEAQHDVAGGIWMTETDARYGTSFDQDQLKEALCWVRHLADEANELFARIAASGRVDPDDALEIFASIHEDETEPRIGPRSERSWWGEDLLRVKAKLAALGIAWEDPAADWEQYVARA
jgi:hypothetical protein